MDIYFIERSVFHRCRFDAKSTELLNSLRNVTLTNVSIFFFYQGFLSRTVKTHRAVGEARGPSSIPIYHFHRLTNIQAFIFNFACEMTITYS